MSFRLIIARLWRKIIHYLPGSELRRCKSISVNSTDCIRHLGHFGRCCDAWNKRWYVSGRGPFRL